MSCAQTGNSNNRLADGAYRIAAIRRHRSTGHKETWRSHDSVSDAERLMTQNDSSTPFAETKRQNCGVQVQVVQVAVLRFVAAFANVPLIALAKVPKAPIAAKVSRTRSNAYSVRSCPSSSFHSLTKRAFMRIPLSTFDVGTNRAAIRQPRTLRQYSPTPTAPGFRPLLCTGQNPSLQTCVLTLDLATAHPSRPQATVSAPERRYSTLLRRGMHDQRFDDDRGDGQTRRPCAGPKT
jgi:hypothetical protein